MRSILILLFSFFLVSCTGEVLPKPKGYLRLTYPKNTYKNLDVKRPYSFSISKEATVRNLGKNWLKINYPKLKASIDITYRPVKNNLRELLIESEKLVFEHAIKADQITAPKEYVNPDKRVFGSIYQISGNAASQIQFHATDSVNHFLKASLFFYTKPNYDSILPAVDYLKNDMIIMMESLEWNY